jgi:hypothetical protein
MRTRAVEPHVRLQPWSHEVHYLEGGLPRPLDPQIGEPLPTSRRRKVAMTDIYPATLMLGVSLAIWAGIAWVLIERIG